MAVVSEELNTLCLNKISRLRLTSRPGSAGSHSMTHNVGAPSWGRWRRGCCWTVIGELEAEPEPDPEPELPEDMLGG